MDAYLEEELYDLLTFCIKEPQSPDISAKKSRIVEIGRELHDDGGTDALENMFFSLENRVKDEIGADAGPFRALWNGLGDWKY